MAKIIFFPHILAVFAVKLKNEKEQNAFEQELIAMFYFAINHST